jgi:predicted RNA binding protein YcfA (HicA-like mRNA interferase family)
MGRIPILKPREAMRILNNLGFIQIRQKGAHCQFRHPDGRQTTVPDHRGRDVSPFLLRQIAKDIDMTIKDFIANK